MDWKLFANFGLGRKQQYVGQGKGSMLTTVSPRSRHRTRITGVKRGNKGNNTGTGSSSRRSSWPDVLSKRWENRITGNDPDSIEAHNIDAIRKHIILKKLNVNTQPRMNRLKQALTQPYGASGEVSYQKARSYDDVLDDRWDKRQERRAEKGLIREGARRKY